MTTRGQWLISLRIATGQMPLIGAWTSDRAQRASLRQLRGSGFGESNANFMVDAASIDSFLKVALRACRSGEDLPWPKEWQGEFQSETALKMFWSRIDYHGICVLLHAANTQFHDWPSKLISRIAEEARLAGLWEVTHGAALAKLLKALADAGVDAVLMKGTALAYSVYDDPSARRRGDSDLLIRPADLERARKVLSQCDWYRDAETHGAGKELAQVSTCQLDL